MTNNVVQLVEPSPEHPVHLPEPLNGWAVVDVKFDADGAPYSLDLRRVPRGWDDYGLTVHLVSPARLR